MPPGLAQGEPDCGTSRNHAIPLGTGYRQYDAKRRCEGDLPVDTASAVQSESDHYRDLPVIDTTVDDMATGIPHLEPAHVVNCPAGALDRVLDGGLDAVRGRACEFDVLVDMVAHVFYLREWRRPGRPLHAGPVAILIIVPPADSGHVDMAATAVQSPRT